MYPFDYFDPVTGEYDAYETYRRGVDYFDFDEDPPEDDDINENELFDEDPSEDYENENKSFNNVDDLGFTYDDKEFEWYEYGYNKYLRYIGKETDGSKIKIPEGITCCDYMFMDSPIETPPVIPDSVLSCNYMFKGCTSLKTPPTIPNGVLSCNYMFEDCTSLEEAPVIPDTVTECASMFCDCKSLKKAFNIPKNGKRCCSMFEDCILLEFSPDIPKGVEDCDYMFQGCESLKSSPVIPEGVKYCNCMFYGCASLVKPPVIPESIEYCDFVLMFLRCSFVQKLDAWGTHEFTYEEQLSLFQGKEITISNYETRGGEIMDITGKFDFRVDEHGEKQFGFFRTDLGKSGRKPISNVLQPENESLYINEISH